MEQWITLAAAILGLIGSIVAVFHIRELKVSVNGHMTELLELTRKAGVQEGKDSEKTIEIVKR